METNNSDLSNSPPQEAIQIATPPEPQPFPINALPTKIDVSNSFDPILNRSPKSPDTSPMRHGPRAPRFKPKPHSCIAKEPSKAPSSFIAKDMPLPPPDRFVSKPTRSNFLRAGRASDHRPTSPIPLILENKPLDDPANQMVLPKFSALDADRLSLAQQLARLDLRDLSEGLARRDWVQSLRPHLHPPAEELLYEPPDEMEPRGRRTLSPPAPVAHALVGAHEARGAHSQRIDARKLHLVLNRHARSLQRAADRVRGARPKDVAIPVTPEDDMIQAREQDAPIPLKPSENMSDRPPRKDNTGREIRMIAQLQHEIRDFIRRFGPKIELQQQRLNDSGEREHCSDEEAGGRGEHHWVDPKPAWVHFTQTGLRPALERRRPAATRSAGRRVAAPGGSRAHPPQSTHSTRRAPFVYEEGYLRPYLSLSSEPASASSAALRGASGGALGARGAGAPAQRDALPQRTLRTPPPLPLSPHDRRLAAAESPSPAPTPVPLVDPSPCRPDADVHAAPDAGRHSLAHSHTERALLSLRALEMHVSQLQADVASASPELLNPVLLQLFERRLVGLERQVLHAAQSVLQSLAVQSHSASCLTRIYSGLRRLFASLSTAFASLHETLEQVRAGTARFQRSIAVGADLEREQPAYRLVARQRPGDDRLDDELPPPPTRRTHPQSKASQTQRAGDEDEELKQGTAGKPTQAEESRSSSELDECPARAQQKGYREHTVASRMKRRSPPPGAWLELLARSRSPSDHSEEGSRRSPGGGRPRTGSRERAAHEERLAQTIAHEVARAVDEKLKHLTQPQPYHTARRAEGNGAERDVDEFVAATRAREELTRGRSGQPLVSPRQFAGAAPAADVDFDASLDAEARAREPPATSSRGEFPSAEQRASSVGDARRVRWQPPQQPADRVTLADSLGGLHPQAEPDELPTADQIFKRLVDIQSEQDRIRMRYRSMNFYEAPPSRELAEAAAPRHPRATITQPSVDACAIEGSVPMPYMVFTRGAGPVPAAPASAPAVQAATEPVASGPKQLSVNNEQAYMIQLFREQYLRCDRALVQPGGLIGMDRPLSPAFDAATFVDRVADSLVEETLDAVSLEMGDAADALTTHLLRNEFFDTSQSHTFSVTSEAESLTDATNSRSAPPVGRPLPQPGGDEEPTITESFDDELAPEHHNK